MDVDSILDISVLACASCTLHDICSEQEQDTEK